MDNEIFKKAAQIEQLRVESLFRLIDQTNHPFLVRVFIKFHRDFLAATFAKKLQFLFFILQWIVYHTRKNLKYFFWQCVTLSKMLLCLEKLEKEKVQSNEHVISVHLLWAGIGDLVNASAFLTALAAKIPRIKFDLYCHNMKGLEFVFAKAHFVRYRYHENWLKKQSEQYAVRLQLAEWIQLNVNSAKKIPADIQKFIDIYQQRSSDFPYFDLYIKKHPHLDAFYAKNIVAKGFNRVTAPGYFLNLPITHEHLIIYSVLPGEQFLSQYALKKKEYITVHDGFDTNILSKVSISTKQLAMLQWEEICSQIKVLYPKLTIVQLGANTSRPISNVTLSLINKTTLEEAAEILQGSLLHIDCESGLVRVASALKTPCITLFGPTNYDYFKIQGNVNIQPQKCGNCYGVTDSWMEKCPRGLETPECVKSISSQEVIRHVRQIIEG